MSDDDPRPIDAFIEQLDRIEATATHAADRAEKAYEEAKATNGRLRKVEDTLWGPDETRRREGEPGVVAKLAETRRLAFDLSTARDESQAVHDVKRWLIGIGVTVIGTMIAALAVLVQLVQAL